MRHLELHIKKATWCIPSLLGKLVLVLDAVHVIKMADAVIFQSQFQTCRGRDWKCKIQRVARSVFACVYLLRHTHTHVQVLLVLLHCNLAATEYHSKISLNHNKTHPPRAQ